VNDHESRDPRLHGFDIGNFIDEETVPKGV